MKSRKKYRLSILMMEKGLNLQAEATQQVPGGGETQF
jgi:hypothetical protein